MTAGVPDERLAIRAGGTAVATCSLWWRETPQLEGRSVGYIGHYSRGDERAARQLLDLAGARLAEAGCAVAVGPIDGSTWDRYRFVTERGTKPPFFLEPDNPACYPDDFRRAGFATFARFLSAEDTELDLPDPRVARAARRLRAAGVTIRAFDLSRFDAELDRMYDVALAAFANNLLFAPISRPAFHALYAPLRDRLDPDFVRIAAVGDRPVGFAFGIPDPTAPDTLIGKTQARLPGSQYAGLGAVMVDDVRAVAARRGLRRMIHALIREDNIALNGSRRIATTIRGYSLFARTLI